MEKQKTQLMTQAEPTTLMDSYYLLLEKMEGLRHLTNISEELIEKMNRTQNKSSEPCDEGIKESCAINERNIVELFNSISKTIDIEGQKIDNNISDAMSFID